MSTKLGETGAVEGEHTLLVEVAEKNPEAEGVVSLVLRPADGRPLPAWEPGAHVDVVLTDGMVRQFSLCGPVEDATTWRLGVLREPSSRGGSLFVHDALQPGHRVSLRGPRNNFRLESAERYRFIAGGIGITPILPMVRQAAALGRPWTLLYGGRSRSSMAFLNELQAIPGGDVQVRPQDEYGLLDLQTFLGDPEVDTLVYCCGPGPLLDAVHEQCAAWPPGSLRQERFAATAKRSASEDPFVVELARSGQRITVPRHESMLDVLEQHGYEITNSCRAGICGTCLTDVVDGEPEHNDDVLSDEERATNKVMLPCVSRSRTDVIIVDL